MQSEKIIGIKKIGKKQCMDIEIKSENHIFYANGIATSNSHWVGYGMTTYLTAYAKNHFPIHFMTASLRHARNKPQPQERARELIEEAEKMGIPVLLPTMESLKYSNNDVCIDNDLIRLGLKSMKGFGQASIDKTVSIIEQTEKNVGKNIADFSWREILLHVLTKTSSDVSRSLITGGVINCGLDRSKMLNDYETISMLTKKQLEILREQDDLIGGLEAVYDEVNKTQKPKIKSVMQLLLSPTSSTEDRPGWLVKQEKSLYGIPITYNQVEVLQQNYTGDTTCKEFLDGKQGEMTIVGEIVDVRKFKIKNGKNVGKMMGVGKLNDGVDTIPIVAFSDEFKVYENSWQKGNCVSLKGIKSDKGSLIVRELKEIY